GSFTLDLRVRLDRPITALFGPSGAGKTTVLDAIAGLRTPIVGSITINERALFDSSAGIDVPPHKRHVGYVAQDVALFPHMSVRRNVLYGRREGQKLLLSAVDVERRRRILPYLERVRDELRVPIVYVTHDRGEASQLADEVIVLDQGRIVDGDSA